LAGEETSYVFPRDWRGTLIAGENLLVSLDGTCWLGALAGASCSEERGFILLDYFLVGASLTTSLFYRDTEKDETRYYISPCG
jgi:hypothetical protein